MNLFPFLGFFDAIVYLFLAVYIYLKNPKALLNRISAVFLFSFIVWSFAMIFIHNPYSSKNTALIFVNIGAIGWVGYNSVFLWFSLALSGRIKILKKKWMYIVLLGFPIIFIYKQWTQSLFTDVIPKYYGWKAVFGPLMWPLLFALYCTVFSLLSLYFIRVFFKETHDPMKKKQANLIFFTATVSLALGSITDLFLPLMRIHTVPNVGSTIVLVFASGVVYAMAKYKFLTISPASAAENIISTMFDCLILLNHEGEIVTVNKATLDLLGYEEDELKGEPVSNLFTKDHQKRDLIMRIIGKGNLKNKDFVFKSKDGRNIPVLFSSSVMNEDAGAKGGIVCVIRDISERKSLEEEIFKIKKLESLGILAGGIAHDFNNLLSVIMGNILMALEVLSPQEKAYKFLVKSEKTVSKASELARKFLTFSPGGWLKKEKVVLSRILESQKSSITPALNISLDIEIPIDLARINGDEDQLKQVFENLILNSVEAMPDGGIISVRAENNEFESKNNLLLKKGQYIKVSVQDNGIGIAKNNIEKVFDPYFSTKNKMSQRGMGLGLTICYSIIKKHEGQITIESDPGKGTTVTLYLPAFIEEELK